MQFADNEKVPFQYFDGVQDVYADPLELLNQIMMRTGGKPNELRKKVFSAPPGADIQLVAESADAVDQLVAVTRDVFRMPPFDPQTGQGAMWAHCLATWDKFAVFMKDEKKNTDTSPTTSPPSGTPPDSSQATPNMSD